MWTNFQIAHAYAHFVLNYANRSCVWCTRDARVSVYCYSIHIYIFSFCVQYVWYACAMEMKRRHTEFDFQYISLISFDLKFKFNKKKCKSFSCFFFCGCCWTFARDLRFIYFNRILKMCAVDFGVLGSCKVKWHVLCTCSKLCQENVWI